MTRVLIIPILAIAANDIAHPDMETGLALSLAYLSGILTGTLWPGRGDRDDH